MSFRLGTIFYVFALFAAAMATFGTAGIIVAVFVLAFWFVIFRGSPGDKNVLSVIVVIALGLFFIIALLMPSVSTPRPVVHRNSCLNSLKQLALAVLVTESAKRPLPPFISDQGGKPLLSWRVQILPRIEEAALYQTIDLSKAWDAPANRAACSASLTIYMCPSHIMVPAMTDYFAVVGPQTTWPVDQLLNLQEIGDGPENTIRLIEASGRKIHWAEPRDLSFDEALELLCNRPTDDDAHRRNNGFFYKDSFIRNVAFADGHVAAARLPLDRKLAAALLTANGGEPFDKAALQLETEPDLDYAVCYSFSVFAILSLLPIAWLGRRTLSPHPLNTPAPPATPV